MGVVYRARDLRRQEVVALKVMQRFEPAALYRFKQEFRALADLSHPNLVALYDLVGDDRHWFFTMELVEGVNFLAHVRAAAEPGAEGPAVSLPATVPAELGVPVPSADASPLTPGRLARLRAALRQLAHGVSVLHGKGKLHRDIKPSNVLVTTAGRVVLLDFGLAVELGPTAVLEAPGEVAGTVAYMAPEQAAGLPLTAACDWYAVGVMLYEALTGRLPFRGSPLDVLHAKQCAEPPVPGAIVGGIPPDLDGLCAALMRCDPGARPVGGEVLRRLGEAAGAEAAVSLAVPEGRLPLVGRAPHLAALAEAFAAAQGRTVVCYVQGRSGMGKSALVKHFLDDLGTRGALILAGRCYEQEAVPYKALDSLMDSLSRHLRALPADEARALRPHDSAALGRLFPVLRQTEGWGPGQDQTPDRQELRRRAFAALRELLGRLAARGPLVLAIDDLQWGDADSAALLTELLRPPEPLPLLLLACYRSEGEASSLCLHALRAAGGSEHRELSVEPLAPAEARQLARALLGPTDPAEEARAEAVACESGGNPFFLHELAQSARTREDNGPAAAVALDEVLWARVQRLPEEARHLLEVVALAGAPLRQGEAWPATGRTAGQRAALALLRSGRLIRSSGPGDEDTIEPYHDRIRETVAARLEPTAKVEHHRRLAAALETAGRADAELLAVHFLGAGAATRAGHYYGMAAEAAAAALAFDRAARLYRSALEVRPADDPGRRALQTRLGEALANAGRGGEAAAAYESAAAGAGADEALELHRRAALQLLFSGRHDEGLRSVRTVLAAVGMRLASTPRRALFSLLLRRAQLRFRGLHFRQRDPARIAPRDLNRIDTCWAVSIALIMTDNIRAADFQTRHLLLALDAGEPGRIARALAGEAGHTASEGGHSARRAAQLLEKAETLARRLNDPYGLAIVPLTRGMIAYMGGRWKESDACCRRSEELFRAHCTGVTWELDTGHNMALPSLFHLGEIAELKRRTSLVMKEAQDRGDLYLLVMTGSLIQPILRLAADEVEGAEEELSDVLGQWSREGFHVQHLCGLLRRIDISLYRGDAARALQLAAELWSLLRSSLLSRVQHIRVLACYFRARSALAVAAGASNAGPLLAIAARDARQLERERVPWGTALARLIQACVAACRRDAAGAAAGLAGAAAALDALDMALYAAAARRRLGRLRGGDEGRALVVGADAWMASQQIGNPARMTALLVPGFPD
jgi:serine/threonine protein kinase